MRLNVSAWAIRRPLPSIVFFVIMLALGLFGFAALPITQMPNVDVPIVAVTVTQPGAAPSELQTQVTKRVEDAIAGVSGVKHITSTITEGTSSTTIEFRLETNEDRALNDVKDAISRIRMDLPRTIDEPIVNRVDIVGLPILVYGISAPAMTPEDLSWFVDDVAARQIQGVRGVGGVERLGGVDREIRIELRPERLNALGVTAADVNAQLLLTSADMAGGRGTLGGQEQSIRTLAGARSTATLAETSIVIAGGRHVRLGDLARIIDTSAEQRTFARLDGKPIVGLAITRAKGASDAAVAQAVAGKVEALGHAHPEARFSLIDSSVDNTVGNYDSAMHGLLEGAGLAVLVVFLFLRDWRATLIAAIALPLSVLPTFWAMNLLGFSLNIVSLLSITLVTGILVDDAIVEIENIARHIRMGKAPYDAALEAADEIGLAVIAITATIIAIFAPVSFMGGIAGQYFKQFGLTIAVAVGFSLLVARLLTPMLAAYFLRPHAASQEREGPVMRAYLRVVRASVRHKFVTLLLGLTLFAASIASTRLLPAGFLPKEDHARTQFSVELPPGARLGDTKAVTDALVRRIAALPEIVSVFVDGGRQIPSKREVRVASLTVTLVPKSRRARSQAEIETAIGAILRDQPDLRFWSIRDNGQRDLALVLGGRDLALVTATAARLRGEMATLPHLVNVISTAPIDRTEIRVVPRSDIAADLGVSTAAIAQTVRIGTIGDIGANLAKFTIGERQIPIRVQLPDAVRGDLDVLRDLRVPVGGGRRRTARDSRRSQAWSRSDLDRPLRPLGAYRRRGRHAGVGRAGRPDRPGHGAADGAPPSRRRDPEPGRRRRDHERGVLRLRACDGNGLDDGAGRPRAALRQRRPALDDPVLASAVDRRRDPRLADLPQADFHAGGYRHLDADGRRDQERHHARRPRLGGDGGRRRSRLRHHRFGAQAGAPHRHDDDRHGGWHGAKRDGFRHRRRVSLADGHCRHRRPDRIDRAVAGLRAGDLHCHGRCASAAD